MRYPNNDVRLGTCPKCDGDHIRSNLILQGAPQVYAVWVPTVYHFVCMDCCYTELSIHKESRDSIAKRWARVEPPKP